METLNTKNLIKRKSNLPFLEKLQSVVKVQALIRERLELRKLRYEPSLSTTEEEKEEEKEEEDEFEIRETFSPSGASPIEMANTREQSFQSLVRPELDSFCHL